MFLMFLVPFALPHTSSTEEKEVTIPSSQSKTFVECDNSYITSNKVDDEPLDIADIFTIDKTDQNQVEPSPVLDFSHYINSQNVSEKTKHFLIKNRVPPKDFKFQPKQYKDNRRSTGVINRYCQLNWFTYSFHEEGLYCIACVLFHTENQREQPCVLLTKPDRNWKDCEV